MPMIKSDKKFFLASAWYVISLQHLETGLSLLGQGRLHKLISGDHQVAGSYDLSDDVTNQRLKQLRIDSRPTPKRM